MKKTLYYVVEKDTQDVGEDQEFTGWKDISVYEIVDNKNVLFTSIEGSNSDKDEDIIRDWLDDNGHEDEEFDFVRL